MIEMIQKGYIGERDEIDEKVVDTLGRQNTIERESEGGRERITKQSINTIVTTVTRAIMMTTPIIEVKLG